MDIIFRCLAVITIGHALRMLTYISTTMPGSAHYCLTENTHLEEDKPKSLLAILFKPKMDTGDMAARSYNCGDLTYSGHLVSTIACALTVARYLPCQLGLQPSEAFVLRALLLALVLLQSLLIIMARHHYTIDVVVALYVMPLIWHWYSTTFPRDSHS